MTNKNFKNKFLASVILLAVTLAPLLDGVACADCHLFPIQKGFSERYPTTPNTTKAISLYVFSEYDKASQGNQTEKGNIACPFCVFNALGTISNSHFEVLFSAMPFLNPPKSLTLLEPHFLKNKPPKS